MFRLMLTYPPPPPSRHCESNFNQEAPIENEPVVDPDINPQPQHTRPRGKGKNLQNLTLRTRAYVLCPRAGTVKTSSKNRPQTEANPKTTDTIITSIFG